MAVDIVARGLAIKAQQGGGGGTSDYSNLSNKPSINGVVLEGNKTTEDLKIQFIASQKVYNYTSGVDNTPEAVAFFQEVYDNWQNNKEADIFAFYENDEYKGYARLSGIMVPPSYPFHRAFFVFSSFEGLNNMYESLKVTVLSVRLDLDDTDTTVTGLSCVSFGENSGSPSDNLASFYKEQNNYDGVLSVKNTVPYTPTAQYHPATKGYVDNVFNSYTTSVNEQLATLTTPSEVTE